LVAAALGALFPSALSPTQVDSSAAILVSIIILISLGPLLQGLYFTACKIHAIWIGQHDHRECQQQQQQQHNDNRNNMDDNVLNV
jgi:hypothetical protein